MQVAHPVSRHAAEAGVAGGVHDAPQLDLADLRAQAVRRVAKLVEGE